MLDFDKNYISLEKIAGQLNLPQKFIREQSKAGKIPHLVVGGRLRYQLKSVRGALNRIEQETSSLPETILGAL